MLCFAVALTYSLFHSAWEIYNLTINRTINELTAKCPVPPAAAKMKCKTGDESYEYSSYFLEPTRKYSTPSGLYQ